MNVRTYDSFEAIPVEARSGLSYPAQPNFFLSYDWFALLFNTTLKSTLTPRIYVLADDQGRTLGALFCGVARSGFARRLLSLTNFYTLEYSPSVVEGAAGGESVINRLVEHIVAERPRWHSIEFKLMKTDLLEVQRVSDKLGKTGFSINPFFQYENWYVPSGGKTFEGYFSERGSQVKNTITRKQKKLEKTHTLEIKLLNNESDGLESAVGDFIAVYNRSWKQAEPFPQFIPMLAAECARLGILRLGVLYVDGKPTAAQLWITTDKKAIIYKLAYDEEYRDFGVGSILSREMFRVGIDEDQVEEIDYGVGSEPYKKDWMSSVRRIEGVEAYNRKTLLGLLLLSQVKLKPPLAALFRRTVKLFNRGTDSDQNGFGKSGAVPLKA